MTFQDRHRALPSLVANDSRFLIIGEEWAGTQREIRMTEAKKLDVASPKPSLKHRFPLFQPVVQRSGLSEKIGDAANLE